MSEPLEQATNLIKAEVHMISGCKDNQTSSDVSCVTEFQIPDPAGSAGGACTSALLEVLYKNHKKPDRELSFQDVLLALRDNLAKSEFVQIPQLTSSRPLNVRNPFCIVPTSSTGEKRALMIGINYVGQYGSELRGCQNDVLNMVDYIKDVHGFKDENISILMDDDKHTKPTKRNILRAFDMLVYKCKPGDAIFVHYAGHGGQLVDDESEEKDGYDETIVPVDATTYGHIRDDVLYSKLVGAMPEGVTLTCVMDCCHSGSVLDLPYKFVGDGKVEDMAVADDFDFGRLAELARNKTASK